VTNPHPLQTAENATTKTAHDAAVELARLLGRQAARDYWAALENQTHVDNGTIHTATLHDNNDRN